MIKQIVALVQSEVTKKNYHSNRALNASVCHTTKSLSVAHALIEKKQIDLLIIELQEPESILQEFIAYVTDISFPTKIVVLAQQDQEISLETCLASGADLVLEAPVSPRCLELYCDKLLNFNKHKTGTLLHLGFAALQNETAHLYIGSKQQQLRKREADILAFFIRHKNQVVSRNMLIDGIWGFCEELPEYTTIDVYVRRLRMKLRGSEAYLKTIRGVGYIAQEFMA